ncbi:hypothetical protein NC651_027043 [Populus alba x Populus x berolinensis]|nr:hypothetical protein NC651_027043 [Populus alba x Populus x berolinensis]
MPITSHYVVSSIPYYCCHGSSLSAFECCFSSRRTNASSSVHHTGLWVCLISLIVPYFNSVVFMVHVPFNLIIFSFPSNMFHL